MTTQKAQIGDYLPKCSISSKRGTYSQIVGITENDGDIQYQLECGCVISECDFNVDDIRLESEIFG